MSVMDEYRKQCSHCGNRIEQGNEGYHNNGACLYSKVDSPAVPAYEFRTVFEVFATIDMRGTEGKKVGTFTDYNLAHTAAEGIGYFGSKGLVKPVRAICIGDKAYILKHNDPIDLNANETVMKERLRQGALMKLTDAEKELLGLKDVETNTTSN